MNKRIRDIMVDRENEAGQRWRTKKNGEYGGDDLIIIVIMQF